jgi:hypothetical protein
MGSSAGNDIAGTQRRWLRIPDFVDGMLSDCVEGEALTEGLFDSPLVDLANVLKHDDETIRRALADAAKMVTFGQEWPAQAIINPPPRAIRDHGVDMTPSSARSSRLMVLISNLARMASLMASAALYDGADEDIERHPGRWDEPAKPPRPGSPSAPFWRPSPAGARPPEALDEWFEALEGPIKTFSDAPFVPLEPLVEWIREGGEILETPTLRLLDEISFLRVAANPKVFSPASSPTSEDPVKWVAVHSDEAYEKAAADLQDARSQLDEASRLNEEISQANQRLLGSVQALEAQKAELVKTVRSALRTLFLVSGVRDE